MMSPQNVVKKARPKTAYNKKPVSYNYPVNLGFFNSHLFSVQSPKIT